MAGKPDIQRPDLRRSVQLDSVRGVAAFIVLMYHCSLTMPASWQSADQPASLPRYLRPGFLLHYTPLHLLVLGPACVLLFFVLSGYVLALSLSGGRFGGYGRFVIRRICRIYIPFAVVIMLSALAWRIVQPTSLPDVSAWFNAEQWSEFPSAMLLLGHLAMVGTPPLQSLDPPMWSLVVEMRISLIFPLLYFAVTRHRAAGLAVVAALYLPACLILSQRGETMPQSFSSSICGTLAYLPVFAAGIMLYEKREMLHSLYQSMSVARRCAAALFAILGFALAHRAALWLTAALPSVPFVRPQVLAGLVSLMFWQVMVGGAAAAIIFMALYSDICRRVLAARPLQWLGTVSYSLYLTHMVVLMAAVHALHAYLPLPAILGLVIPLALAVAALSYRWIEEPSIALGRRLARAPRRTPVIAVPQAPNMSK